MMILQLEMVLESGLEDDCLVIEGESVFIIHASTGEGTDHCDSRSDVEKSVLLVIRPWL